jgi:hypothetical protein
MGRFKARWEGEGVASAFVPTFLATQQLPTRAVPAMHITHAPTLPPLGLADQVYTQPETSNLPTNLLRHVSSSAPQFLKSRDTMRRGGDTGRFPAPGGLWSVSRQPLEPSEVA